MKVDTLIYAGWIIPVVPEGLVLRDHAVALRNGKILDILPWQQAEQQYRADTVTRLPQHALIPGLVNAHTHAGMSLLRGVADDLQLMEWLQGHIWPLEQQWVGETFVRDSTELAIAEMIRGGVTCFSDMYFFPEVSARLAISAGIRATIGMILIDFSSAWAENSDQYLARGLALHDELRGEPLISTAFAPHAPYTVSDPALVKMRVLAEELQRPIHMHVHETAGEIQQSLEQYGQRPLQRLKQLAIAGPALVAVHMTQLTDEEIELLAREGASVVHCPHSNLKLASGFCPVARLQKAGVNVALGTDSNASNNNLDMLSEMKTAALLAKAVAGDARVVPAKTALAMATLNGARALKLEHEIGSLETGKAADITAVHLQSLETQPLFDPISQIVYAAGREQVTDVWVAGRPLLRNRELTTLDLASIQAKTARWAERIATLSTH